jgi:hypothetical protein
VIAGLAKPPKLMTWGEFAASSASVTVAARALVDEKETAGVVDWCRRSYAADLDGLRRI